jgi:DNA-binding transcriptional MocR family regulator
LRWPHFAPLVKVLYQVLLTYCGAGEAAWPGQDRLARDCGVSINTIRPALETLQAAGLVSITRRGLNRTNLYHVHKLPLVLAVPTKDTQKLRIQTTNIGVSKRAKSAAKVHSVETQTEETGVDPQLLAAIRTFAGKHRQNVTPEQVAALAARAGSLARWQEHSAGAGSLAEVQARLGEGE